MSNRRRRLVKNTYVDLQKVRRYERTESIVGFGEYGEYPIWHHVEDGFHQLVSPVESRKVTGFVLPVEVERLAIGYQSETKYSE